MVRITSLEVREIAGSGRLRPRRFLPPLVNEPGCTRCKKVHYATQHPLNPRSGSASQRNPTARPTGPCLTGESAHAFRPRADRQARLEPLALIASGHDGVVN